MSSEIEQGIVRPTGPGDKTEWLADSFDPPPPPNWDCVNGAVFDPNAVVHFVVAPLAHPVGSTDLYVAHAPLAPSVRFRSITVFAWMQSFSIGPAPPGEVALLIKTGLGEKQGRTIQVPGETALISERFEGSLRPEPSAGWLQIGLKKIAQATSMILFQMWALLEIEHPRLHVVFGR